MSQQEIIAMDNSKGTSGGYLAQPWSSEQVQLEQVFQGLFSWDLNISKDEDPTTPLSNIS